MQIKQVEVEKLYGLHDYTIPFDTTEYIKIIHAPNGYGKTTLIKLIHDIITCKLLDISIIPFKRFCITMTDSISIEVIKTEDSINYNIIKGSDKQHYKVINPSYYPSIIDETMPISYIEKNLPFLKRIAQTAWYDTRENEKIGYEDIVHNYGEYLFMEEGLRRTLKKIEEEMPVYFINANRLTLQQRDGKSNSYTKQKTFTPSVLAYAKALEKEVQHIITKSATLAQTLDRSFPKRLIQRMKETNNNEIMSIEEVQMQLKDLEKRRTHLQKIGFLTSEAQKEEVQIDGVDSETLKVLSLYIEDSKKKLAIFTKLEEKINLMRKIINEHFAYKKMEIHPKKGFAFRLPDGTLLSAEKLSSGEQNQLILIFELLFNACPEALILIDEPEISLHIAWQQKFLEDMEAIAKLINVHMIIATHSPDIINGRWELTTGLEEC